MLMYIDGTGYLITTPQYFDEKGRAIEFPGHLDRVYKKRGSYPKSVGSNEQPQSGENKHCHTLFMYSNDQDKEQMP